MKDSAVEAERLYRSGNHPGELFPPIIYVPCGPARNDNELEVDLRLMSDGRLALPVYSAMDRLVAKCGPGQPWRVFFSTDLERIRLATGFDMIVLDVDIPEELRRTGVNS
ncbi:hypothetical protein GCM10027456_60050 [Kineosporia babensis]